MRKNIGEERTPANKKKNLKEPNRNPPRFVKRRTWSSVSRSAAKKRNRKMPNFYGKSVDWQQNGRVQKR
jgi:hypothetical protein